MVHSLKSVFLVSKSWVQTVQLFGSFLQIRGVNFIEFTGESVAWWGNTASIFIVVWHIFGQTSGEVFLVLFSTEAHVLHTHKNMHYCRLSWERNPGLLFVCFFGNCCFWWEKIKQVFYWSCMKNKNHRKCLYYWQGRSFIEDKKICTFPLRPYSLVIG